MARSRPPGKKQCNSAGASPSNCCDIPVFYQMSQQPASTTACPGIRNLYADHYTAKLHAHYDYSRFYHALATFEADLPLCDSLSVPERVSNKSARSMSPGRQLSAHHSPNSEPCIGPQLARNTVPGDSLGHPIKSHMDIMYNNSSAAAYPCSQDPLMGFTGCLRFVPYKPHDQSVERISRPAATEASLQDSIEKPTLFSFSLRDTSKTLSIAGSSTGQAHASACTITSNDNPSGCRNIVDEPSINVSTPSVTKRAIRTDSSSVNVDLSGQKELAGEAKFPHGDSLDTFSFAKAPITFKQVPSSVSSFRKKKRTAARLKNRKVCAKIAEKVKTPVHMKSAPGKHYGNVYERHPAEAMNLETIDSRNADNVDCLLPIMEHISLKDVERYTTYETCNIRPGPTPINEIGGPITSQAALLDNEAEFAHTEAMDEFKTQSLVNLLLSRPQKHIENVSAAGGKQTVTSEDTWSEKRLSGEKGNFRASNSISTETLDYAFDQMRLQSLPRQSIHSDKMAISFILNNEDKQITGAKDRTTPVDGGHTLMFREVNASKPEVQKTSVMPDSCQEENALAAGVIQELVTKVNKLTETVDEMAETIRLIAASIFTPTISVISDIDIKIRELDLASTYDRMTTDTDEQTREEDTMGAYD